MSAKMKLVASSAALALMAYALPASAADVIVEEPAAPAPIETLPVASWAGPYAGLSLGYGFAGRADVPGVDIETDGFVGGGFAGYNFQNGMFVFGGEVDLNYAGLSGSNAGIESQSSLDGSIRARAGVAVTDNVLFYGTAGGAGQSLEITDAVGSDRQSMFGWTAGAGVDVKMTENVFGRLEYRYSDYGSKTFDTGSGPRSVDASDNRITFGIGMKF